ncbi:MAG: hypothetical protein GQ570_11805 [Helicobacteraceae bacterium]|nr:hypothetical protein [Helicobacteraceae bacterium]
MTNEELEAELTKANEKIDGLVESKKTILDEKKKLEKKYKEVDADEYFNLRDKFDTLESEHRKLENTLKGKDRDIETLSQTNESLSGTNTKLIMDDGFTKELLGLERYSVREGGLDVTIEALKKHKPTIVDGVAMFGDKSAKDFISDWSNSKDSSFYLQAKENSGGGSNGGNGGNQTPPGKTPNQKEELGTMFGDSKTNTGDNT